MLVVIFFILGLCAGSFINATVWRVKQQSSGKKGKNSELSIMKGRSVCPHCRHELVAKDLVPVLSWLSLRGRCRYCKKPIDDSPIVELAMGVVFATSYLWWPVSFSANGQKILFASWLLASIGLMALLVYDLRWMLLPNRILYPALAVAVAGRLVYLVGFSGTKREDALQWLFALAIASGLFWLLFTYSKGKWIGYGDVRLGLVTGTLLGTGAKAFGMIFVASVLGTLAILPALASHKKTLVSRIPFGPFLIIATYILVLFGGRLSDIYTRWLIVS